MADTSNNSDLEEILYFAMAGVGLVALHQLWDTKIRPWIESTWGEIQSGQVADLPVVGTVDQADLIGLGVLAVPVVVVLILAVTWAKRRKRSKSRSIDPAVPNAQ